MAKKRKTFPDNLQDIIDSNDLSLFKSVFDKCEISATKRPRTTENIFSYKNLTLEHIQFLVENGIDLNADSGWGYPPIAFLADNLELLKYLIDSGADIEKSVDKHQGNALFICAKTHKVQSVKNLLSCGADPNARGGWSGYTALDETLQTCRNLDIINTVEIAKYLLACGAHTSDKTKEYVKKIGENFEFIRPNFNKESVDEYSQSLDELYSIFDVQPVQRRVVFDGKSPIVVNSKTWQKQFDELWNLLVPGVGHANTIQGELIRVIGRITNELLDNGGINWDIEYEKMVKSLPKYFETFKGEDTNKTCMLAAQITVDSNKELLYQLTEITVGWVLQHNQPIHLDAVDYKR